MTQFTVMISVAYCSSQIWSNSLLYRYLVSRAPYTRLPTWGDCIQDCQLGGTWANGGTLNYDGVTSDPQWNHVGKCLNISLNIISRINGCLYVWKPIFLSFNSTHGTPFDLGTLISEVHINRCLFFLLLFLLLFFFLLISAVLLY